MRTRARPPKRTLIAIVAGLVAAGGVSIAAAGTGGDPSDGAKSWRSAFEPRRPLQPTHRVIVVLAAPSLADRVAAAGKLPAPKQQRSFVRRADALQRRLVQALRARGIGIRRHYVYTRVLNGFSATVDARALAALSHTPGVAGIYPVRAVYPAALGATTLTAAGLPRLAPTAEAPASLPGEDGSGVTVALLDSGVDRRAPALRGRVGFGVDLVDRDANVLPVRPAVERHGTRMASLLVGSGAVPGVAPGARVLPIRILSARKAQGGGYQEAGWGDALVAGIERAVDPDGDGDVEDAARVALTSVVEPYASFPDSPESMAVTGALRLGTLVVAAAGNDGPAGAGGFGTVGAPAGGSAALAVGAVDARTSVKETEVTLSAGPDVLYAGRARLLGGLPPAGTAQSELAAAGQPSTGRAVLLPGDGTPLLPRVRDALRKGATAVVVYGTVLPAGGLGLEEDAAAPVIALPASAGEAAAAAARVGTPVALRVAPQGDAANPDRSRVADFSSRGAAFDGSAKPDVVAPGVGLVAADPRTADGAPAYAVVSGTSAAAAVAAGAAALVAQARPELGAAALRSVLVGSARQVNPGVVEPVTAAGAGLIDPSAADAAELAVTPASISVEAPAVSAWSSTVTVRVRNVAATSLHIGLGVTTDIGAAYAIGFAASPAELTLGPGEEREVRLFLSSSSAMTPPATVSGVLVLEPDGGPVTRVPWSVSVAPAGQPLLRAAKLSRTAFPAGRPGVSVLSFLAGGVTQSSLGPTIFPVGLVDVELWTASGRRLGTIARLHDLLPGRYTLALAGRDPDGAKLPPGRYELHLVAQPVSVPEGGDATRTVSLPFAIVRGR
jgi:hypothetical protein